MNLLRCGDLVVNCNDHTVSRAGLPVTLSAKKFQLLLNLVRNQGLVVTREQIENNLWQLDASNSSNIIDVYIRYLCKKIDDGHDDLLISELIMFSIMTLFLHLYINQSVELDIRSSLSRQVSSLSENIVRNAARGREQDRKALPGHAYCDP